MCDGQLPALGVLSILIVASLRALGRDWQRYRRPGPIGGVLMATWALTAAFAYAAARYRLV